MERFYDISELESDVFSDDRAAEVWDAEEVILEEPENEPEELAPEEFLAPEELTLELSNHQTMTCEVLAVFLYEETEYMALLPKENAEGILFLRMEEGKNGELLLSPLEEKQSTLVSEAFQEWYQSKVEEEKEIV